MKIGIIVYSQSGNTLQVAQRLASRLQAKGHEPVVEQVTVAGGKPVDPQHVQLAFVPNPGAYDALVFATPVQGFAVAPPMAVYLAQLPVLANKKICCLVTHYFPLPSLGGRQTIAQMTKVCREKGGTVSGSGIINWMRRDREKQIETVIGNLADLY